MATFTDNLAVLLPAIGTFTDSSLKLLDPSTFTLSASAGSTSVFTLTADTPIPGTSLTMLAGSTVYQLDPMTAPGDVTITPSGFVDGSGAPITVAPFVVSDVAPAGATLVSVAFNPLQV